MKKSRLLGAVCVCLSAMSFNARSAIMTYGYLSSDDTTNIITNSIDNVEYLRLDVLADLTYAETLAVLDTQDGGGWSIATASDALAFTNAILAGASTCTHDGTDVLLSSCGDLTGWVMGEFGDNHQYPGPDYAWFIDNAGMADYINLGSSGSVDLGDFSMGGSDSFSASGNDSWRPISWLVTRPAVVPIPASAWLFVSGLLGLIGMARRKAA